MFKNISIVLFLALLVLTACSSGGGGGQPANPTNPSTKDPTNDTKKEPTSDTKKEPTSDTKKVPTSDPLPVATYKLPDTGQTDSRATSTFGEDADYTINSPSYRVDSAKKTVFDNNTGLMWQQLPTSGDHVQRSHADASTYCGAQTTGGYNDWRLPSIDELASIVNLGRDTSPAIDIAAFPNTKGDYYWSSSRYAPDTSNVAWYTHFYIGFWAIKSRTDRLYVRCVRLSPDKPAKRFTINRDQTTFDHKTKLMWQQLPDAGDHKTYNWENALNRCEGLTFAGYSDWRLPNKKELSSIIDYSHSGPAIDPNAFPNTKSSRYHASTVSASNISQVWSVDFDKGFSSRRSRSQSLYVRCVR